MAGKGKLPTEDGSKICFIICPIGKEDSKEREWSDTVIDEIIKPIAEEKFGYSVLSAKDIDLIVFIAYRNTLKVDVLTGSRV